MRPTFARIAWLALLVAMFASPARASEAPEPPPRAGATARLCAGSSRAFAASIPLGLLGPATFLVGGYQWWAVGVWENNEAAGRSGIGLMLVGAGATVVGVGLAMGGVWGHTSCLRRKGIDVSDELAIAAIIVPLSLTAASLVTATLSPEAALVVGAAAYVSPFAFGAAQVVQNSRRIRNPRGLRVAAAPGWVGRSPGLVVQGRF